MRALIAALLTALVTSSCAPVLASLAMGYERGRADMLTKKERGIAFLERKPSSKKPAGVVVLLHGHGGDKDHWPFLAAELPRELWLIAPDLPGDGDSDKDPKLSYDLDSQARRLHDFLHARGVPAFHLVGNSLGGELAVVYALHYPDDVRSLVLLDPAGMDRKTEHAFPVKKPEDFDRLVRSAFAHPPEIPGVLRDYFAAQAIAADPLNEKMLADARARAPDFHEVVPTLKQPTLVVWGDDDKLIDPSTAQEWRDAVPSHLVVMMRDTGHGPMVERPAETAQLMLTWWSRLLKR